MENLDEKKDVCGIVMPISAIDGCPESHWSDVLQIVRSAVEVAGFEGNLVSSGDDVGIIQKRIIQNLYDNPIVVCDVSGKNPNVMFELGLRLAFDKPTIIIKDDKTSYSFDTSPIEHLEYPRDLRFSKIVEFKERLSEKLQATIRNANDDPNYTTFLKNFGEFKVAKINQKEVSEQEYVLEEIRSLRQMVERISLERYFRERLPIQDRDSLAWTSEYTFPIGFDATLLVEKIKELPGVLNVDLRSSSSGASVIRIFAEPTLRKRTVSQLVDETYKQIQGGRSG